MPPAGRRVYFEVSADEYRLLGWAKNHIEPADMNRWLRQQILRVATTGARQRLADQKPVPQWVVEIVDELRIKNEE